MSNDERSTKQRRREDDTTIIRHLIIRHSFDLRHSDFVILAPGLDCEIGIPIFLTRIWH
jgi:hypothetical protein